MLRQLSNIALGVIFGALLPLILRQFLVEQINFFLNPIIKLFWHHALHHPEGKSPLDCPKCAHKFFGMPN